MILTNPVVSVNIPATTEEFVVADKIVVNTSENAEVRIFRIGGKFKDSFGNKKEQPMAAHMLYGQDLTQRSTDGLLIGELGGKEKAITSWAEVHTLIKAQPHSSQGLLNVQNFSSNIFFIPEDDSRPQENVHPVALRYGSSGWDIMVYMPNSTGEWLIGGRVFKRAADAR